MMNTPGQKDRSDRMNQYLMDQTRSEIEDVQEARQRYEDTINGNDTGMTEEEAEAAWKSAEAALDEARALAWEKMPSH